MPTRKNAVGHRQRLRWVYSRYMDSTTIKLSVHTRDRLKSYGGDTYEATVIDALDALDAQRFWSQVDAALQQRDQVSSEQRERALRAEAEVDAAFDGIV